MAIFRVPVNLTWSGGGSPGVNVFHVRDDAWPGSTSLDGALSALSAAYGLLTAASTGLLTQNLKVTLGDIVELESNEYVAPGAGAWTDRTSAMGVGMGPAPCMLVIAWKTSLAARRGMGRTFLGPVASSCLEGDGSPSLSALNVAKAFGQRLVDHNATAGAANFGVYGAQSAPVKNTPRPEGYPRVLRDITDFRVKDKWSVLRSRRD